MNASVLLILALTTQETLFSHYAIFQARLVGISWIEIHLIWTFITLLHLVVPYFFARFLARRIKNIRFKEFIGNIEKRLRLQKNIHNYFFIVLLGIVNYIYLNSFILGFLGIKSKKVFVCIFVGDLIWYLLVLSASFKGIDILKNLQTLAVAVAIVVILSLGGKWLISKNSR
jgi:hypothetical protein